MSDRVAVFNEGRIEQVGPPAEIYEQPGNDFVAGFVGASNLLERDGHRFTVRPRRSGCSTRETSADGLQTERGRVVDVAYAGMITRYLVELEAAGHASGRAPEPRDVVAGGARGGRDNKRSWDGRRNTRSPIREQARERRRNERTVEEPGPMGLADRRSDGLDRVRGRLRRR